MTHFVYEASAVQEDLKVFNVAKHWGKVLKKWQNEQWKRWLLWGLALRLPVLLYFISVSRCECGKAVMLHRFCQYHT